MRLAFDFYTWRATQADRDFIDILARMRTGACSSVDLRELEARCSRCLDLSDGILPTMVRRYKPAVPWNLGCTSPLHHQRHSVAPAKDASEYKWQGLKEMALLLVQATL